MIKKSLLLKENIETIRNNKILVLSNDKDKQDIWKQICQKSEKDFNITHADNSIYFISFSEEGLYYVEDLIEELEFFEFIFEVYEEQQNDTFQLTYNNNKKRVPILEVYMDKYHQYITYKVVPFMGGVTYDVSCDIRSLNKIYRRLNFGFKMEENMASSVKINIENMENSAISANNVGDTIQNVTGYLKIPDETLALIKKNKEEYQNNNVNVTEDEFTDILQNKANESKIQNFLLSIVPYVGLINDTSAIVQTLGTLLK